MFLDTQKQGGCTQKPNFKLLDVQILLRDCNWGKLTRAIKRYLVRICLCPIYQTANQVSLAILPFHLRTIAKFWTYLPQPCSLKSVVAPDNAAKVDFIFIWMFWHQTILDWQILSFPLPPYTRGEEKHFKIAGIVLRSSCSVSDHSNQWTMTTQVKNCYLSFLLNMLKKPLVMSLMRFLLERSLARVYIEKLTVTPAVRQPVISRAPAPARIVPRSLIRKGINEEVQF